MKEILEQHIRDLSMSFLVAFDSTRRELIVQNVPLEPGFNRHAVDIHIILPSDYPLTPPGTSGYGVYMDAGLRFNGRRIRDFHGGDDSRLAWFCYTNIEWDPHYDNLQTLLGRIRADLARAADASAPSPAPGTTGLAGWINRAAEKLANL